MGSGDNAKTFSRTIADISVAFAGMSLRAPADCDGRASST